MITKEEVQHIASLARIGMSKQETEKMAIEMSAVLEWIDQLKEADVTGVEPTAHITGMENRLRQDMMNEFHDKKEIIKLFPEEKDGYDKVKAIL